MKIKKCRVCNSRLLQQLFSLGKMKFTGKFPKKNQFIPSGDVNLVMCNKCRLVQLKDNFNLRFLYNIDTNRCVMGIKYKQNVFEL